MLLLGMVLGAILILGVNKAVHHTSSDEYCQSCHIHTLADEAWTRSVHYITESGNRTGCVDCHLPPKGDFRHFRTKVRTGMHDWFAYHFKDHASFNWEAKGQLEHARGIVFNESCEDCHPNLFPKGLTEEGGKAHLYYDMNAEELDLHCINCHLNAGHFIEGYTHGKLAGTPSLDRGDREIFTAATELLAFEDFTEKIPGTSVSFNMVAIEGGTFRMGSPEDEPLRREDEGPVRTVELGSFFMGEAEVSWDEYWTFYSQTMSEGRIAPEEVYARNESGVDGISGPTPPFGNPGQGWGDGARPAITMSHYAARTYCQWLSQVTGKKYRLPTEAEWEYACRGGTESPYFFEGDPQRFVEEGLRNRIFGVDTAGIASHSIYALNSGARTGEPSRILSNPYGLKNMTGNVWEFCSDWYAGDAYSLTGLRVSDPRGPSSGSEWVIRGGSYASHAGELRSAARASTQTEEWLKTDCQQPKSIWWYSDMKGIGFRVVCESMPQ